MRVSNRTPASPYRTTSTPPTLFTPLQAIYTPPSGVAALFPTARWNRRPRKFLRLRIKPHHGVRLHSRFAVPHHAIRRDGDSIRSRPPSARRRPHLHCARHWIEPPQIPTVVIRKINLVLGIDRHPPRPRALRQLVLRDLHRLRIDLRHLVRPEFAEERHALAVDRNSIRKRPLPLHLLQLDLAALRVQPPYHVPHLHREPQNPPRIEHRRMRILRPRIRHLIHLHVPALRIELPDVPLPVPGEPDTPARIRHQSVRP